MVGNAVVVNFSGGETSPRSRGRFDQPWYQTSARKMLNMVAEIQGPARFRPGLVYSYQTRQGAIARAVDFEINATTAYLLEFTPGYLRVRNPLTQTLLYSNTTTLTSITKAGPAVLTAVAMTGISNGKEIILSNVTGMPQLNNRQFVVANVAGSTFNLADPITAALLDTSAFAAAATAGTVSVIYEITTPYSALDLTSLQFSSTRSLAYVTTGTQPAQKLTVDGNGALSIGAYSRTNDPFQTATTLTVRGITPGVLFDDFSGGLGSWTISNMIVQLIAGSNRATSSDTARAASGYTSASMFAAQAITTGDWEFDLVYTGPLGDTVADSSGASFAGIVNAYARFLPIYKDANNFYELRVYGTACNSFRLYFNNAGVASLVGTFSTGTSVNGSLGTSHIQLKRDGAGVPLPLAQQDLAQLAGLQGLTPVILDVRPARSAINGGAVR